MQNRSPKKNILLIVLCIIAITAVFILVYKKHPETGNTPTATAEAPQEAAPVIEAPKTAFNTHMALTSDNIIWFTNYYRTQKGLPPLTLSTQLRDSAYFKSLDMFKYHYFDHYRPTNKLGFDNFVDNQKYSFIKIGENLAKGDFTTSKEIVDAWMRSAPHQRNIMDPNYTEIGVSVDYGTMDGERIVLITQHFGKPKTICPEVSDDLYTKIKNLNKQLSNLRDQLDTGGQQDSIIARYNLLIKDREVMVSNYNAQVDAFDRCVTRG
jgi:uncharacterized protein YkwD